MLYLTCTTITNVDLTHYGISRAKVWVSVNCGTNKICIHVSVSNHDIIMGPWENTELQCIQISNLRVFRNIFFQRHNIINLTVSSRCTLLWNHYKIFELTHYPLYPGGPFHWYILDETICHDMGVGSILWILSYFWRKFLLANNVDPNQTPHNVASDLGLHCLPETILRVSR